MATPFFSVGIADQEHAEYLFNNTKAIRKVQEKSALDIIAFTKDNFESYKTDSA